MIMRDALTRPHWRKCKHEQLLEGRCQSCFAKILGGMRGRRNAKTGAHGNPIWGVPVSQAEPPALTGSTIPASSLGGTCPHGHPRTKDTVYIRPNGKKACRVCRAAASRVAMQKKREIA